MTVIVYLIGKSGVGKYSIAKELRHHDYIICDNQLINNPIFALLDFHDVDGGKISEFAWHTINKIRKNVFAFIGTELSKNYVLTNELLNDEGDRNLFRQVKQLARKRHSIFIPIKLSISQQEHVKRIQNPQRKERYKSTDVKDVYSKTQLIEISHPNLIELDITELSAKTAAQKILIEINKIKIAIKKIKIF